MTAPHVEPNEPLDAPEPSPAPSAEPLGLELEAAQTHERRRAMRALLQRPLLSARGPHAHELSAVRRHAPWLRAWLSRNTGWGLHVDSETARLRKTAADLSDATRPARDPLGRVPFTRRRYVLFCLALAALEHQERQTTLGRLADAVVDMVAADPVLAGAGIVFDLTSQDQRRDIVQVVRLLLDLRVLTRVAGDEQQFLERRGDALYTLHRPALALTPLVQRPPSLVRATEFEGRLQAMAAEPLPDTEDARNRGLRWRLTRRLLDDPVLYYAELDLLERAYLNSQRSLILSQISEATGLIGEVRSEGIAMVDAEGTATDLGMPEEGTDGHVALLLAEFLAARLRDRPDESVGLAALEQHAAELGGLHRLIWRRDATLPGAEKALVEATLDRLEALRLVRRVEGGVVPLPAIARYALDTGSGQRKKTRLLRAGLKLRRRRKP